MKDVVTAPLTSDTTAADKGPLPQTVEEFLAWGDEDTWAEWRDGEIIMMSPASDRHQDIVRFLVTLFSLWLERKARGVVRPAPFAMRLKRSVREPDLLVVTEEHRDRLTPTYLDGPADLVVEVVSPESVGRDRGEKFYEYEEAGVQEYWLIDPQREVLEVYVLNGERFKLAFMEHTGRYESRVLPGFWVEAEWFWQDPLPSLFDILRKLALIS